MSSIVKLIRDNIPELSGNKVKYAKIETYELYVDLLKRKLIEEVNEYLENNNLEELADILTVIRYLTITLGATDKELEEIYRQKLNKNGGFDKKLVGFFDDQNN